MRIATSFVVFALVASACGADPGGTTPPPDTPPVAATPIGFTFEAIEARSFASFGWSGLIHNVRVPERTPFGVAARCDGPDGICSFTGPTDPKGNNKVNRKRCRNRTRTTCNTDSDCGATPGLCVYIYDPPASSPLPGMGGKIGACSFSYIPIAAPGAAPTIVGTLDLASGDLNLSNLTIRLPQNGLTSPLNPFRGACAECIGDPVMNDGKQEGMCVSARHGEQGDPSPDIGQPCDKHRDGSIPGFEGETSMDCSPSVVAADGPGAGFGGVFTSSGYEVDITQGSPDCSDSRFPGDPAHPGKKCFCGMCSDLSRVCMSNADCPASATCGALPPNCNPNPPRFDDLGNQNADWVATKAMGECRDVAAVVTATRGNSCREGKCNWNPETGTGTCTSLINNSTVGCYPSGIGASIVSLGGARKQGDVYIADTANARCTPMQSTAAANGQLGLPGLTFQRRAFRIIPEFPQ